MKLKTVGLILLVAGAAFIGFGLFSSVFSVNRLDVITGPYLTVTVKDAETNQGIKGANVYFFAGEGTVEAPENALVTRSTDNTGKVVVTALGSVRIGVIASGYTSDSSTAGYSHWGTVYVDKNVTYSVLLYAGNPSGSIIPSVEGLIENRGFYSLIVGGILGFAGLVCVVVDKVNE